MSAEPEFPQGLIERCAKRVWAIRSVFQNSSGTNLWTWEGVTPEIRDYWLTNTEVALRESGHAELVAALKWLDAYWTETFPGGPDEPEHTTDPLAKSLGGRLSDETVSGWRNIRAALAKAEALS